MSQVNQSNYDDKEIRLIIEDKVKISTKKGDIYFIKAGDLVKFLLDLSANGK